MPGQIGGVLLGVWIVAVLPDAELRWIIGLPVLWLGLRVGAWTHDKLPGRAFNLIILGIALAGSLRLLMG